MFNRRYDHQVKVFVSNGSVAHFTLREMHELYRSWQMWALVMFGFFIMSTGHQVTMPQFDSFGLSLAFWFIALFIYLLATEFYALATWRIWHRIFGGPIPLVILSAPLVLASTYVTGAFLTILFEPGRPPFEIMTWQMNLRNVVVAHVFETVALVWLIPAQRARRAQIEMGRKITLAGRSFVLDEIVRVKAAEHYLEVHGPDGVEVIRERMATFLEQVAPKDGIQTHRSHWVACTSAVSMSGAKLRLTSGEKVPIARGRLDDVRDWFRTREGSGEAA